MKIASVLFAAALLLLNLAPSAAAQSATAVMPVEEVRAGMRGIVRTTFSGTDITEVPAVVIGVLPDILGPKADLIIVKLEGDRLDFQGIAGGMSGSPFYIDGKLVGALAYRLGDFPKEPVGGVTPIREMLNTQHGGRGGPVMIMDYYRIFGDSPAFRAVSARLGKSSESTALPGRQPLPGGWSPLLGNLSLTGISAESVRRFLPGLESTGWRVAGAGTAGILREPIAGELQPGMPVAVPLVYGDMYFGSSGTVTHVDDKKVWAYGHPFNQLGNIRYPMARAEMLTVLTSLSGSNNIVNIGQVIGAFTQDRATAIYGEIGATANSFDLRINVTYGGKELDKYSFTVARDSLMSPGLIALTVNSALLITQGQIGEMAARITGTVAIEGEESVRLDNLYSGLSVINDLSILPASLYYFLNDNEFRPVTVKSIDLDIDIIEELKTATLERAWLTRDRVKTGDRFELVMELKPRRGKPVFYREQYFIPPTLQPGKYVITVGNGEAISQQENAMVKGEIKLRDLSHMIRLLNTLRSDYKLYAQTFREEEGAYFEGDFFPGLPPSALSIIRTNKGDDNFVGLSGTVMDERQVVTDYVVNGMRRLTFTVTR